MLENTSRSVRQLIVIIFLMSLILIAINRIWFGYPGLFYFENNLFGLALFLFAFCYGLKLQFPQIKDSFFLKFLSSLNLYVMLILLILLSTTAIQYTPFAPIDRSILKLEHALKLNLQSAIDWTNTHAMAKVIFYVVYHSLGLQLVYIPLVTILFRSREEMNEFYFLLLFCWLIGSSFYYFFPTTAPASILSSDFFDESQYFTGLKFWQVHHYIQPVTADGGMVAMPSFHVIWAWLCVYLIRCWPIACGLLASINFLLVASCVGLGWHYYLDILASVIILFSAHKTWGFIQSRKMDI